MGSFGHTGFTGTSIWLDPASQAYVVLLTNAVHPHERKAITPLRGKIATIVAAAVSYEQAAVSAGETQTGLDVLERENFRTLQGKHVGLITNQTGVDRAGRRNIDVMRAAGVNLVALFSPEHGFAGVEDHENISNAVDPATGLKVWSLYDKTRRPTPEMLRGLDALVFDIQDIGVRFYTYEATMIYAMEEAAKAKIPFYVLDRPNPLTGLHVEGPMLDAGKMSFTGAHALPLRHGMTIGELAKLVNGERKLGAELRVVEMAGWNRAEWFDATGLPWVNPSPNIRNLNQALLYPGLALLEGSTNYSLGRGTDAPFEQVGADWIKGTDLARRLRTRAIPGVQFYPVRFMPVASNLSGKQVEGLSFVVTNRDAFSSARLGLELAEALGALYPKQMKWEANRRLIGNDAVVNALSGGGDAVAAAATGMASFLDVRRKYLIYR